MTSPNIAIVGAGIGGLACARTLQQHGRSVTVFEREASPRSRWQGGMLDLHVDTGQAALRAANLFEEFSAVARPEGQEMRGLDPYTGALIHHELPVEGAGNAPEIDRGQLRDLFLDALAPDTIRWGHPVTSADALTEDFDLVIGADGTWSRIRPALSTATPIYTGDLLVETFLDADRHPEVALMVGNGTLAAKSGRLMLSAQRNSRGHIRVYAGLPAPADSRVDLLEVFEGWHDGLLDLIRQADGDFVNRPLYVLPVGHRWDHVPGVTLLGDAAHLMPPYGIGANLAMLDGTDLATAIISHDDLDAAVRSYENLMLPRARAAAEACAELTATLVADTVVDVESARHHLNDRIQRA
ncbi:FAD-dependent oxidoreductase [Nonomuraea sp. NPDC050556]|uniref:FAD-dependent oxidoreductase n=1 Tax=Nonomuraea sp. NPDC050556 TaxID=3364369 RepID=UPI00378869CF